MQLGIKTEAMREGAAETFRNASEMKNHVASLIRCRLSKKKGKKSDKVLESIKCCRKGVRTRDGKK